ncbi:MAG: metal ABC transporter solute-binding protein, Zn/Mn family [Thermodesulfobacteriota bacterium]
MQRSATIAALLFALLAMAARPGLAGQISAFVSIVPQQYFLEQIGGDRVDVHVMVPPGANPATYEPAPTQMTKLAKADLYFTVGVPFENAWMDKLLSANPDLKVIHTEAGIEKRSIERRHPDDGRSEGTPDPHIWLSPPLVMLQARNILTALAAADAAHSKTYAANYQQFIQQIVDLDLRLRRRLSASQNRRFMVFHPSWGYFADAYGLSQVAIEVEGKSPKGSDIQRLIRLAKKHEIRRVLVQPQFSSRNAETIAGAIDGQTVIADPLAGNWPENLLTVADRIRERSHDP